MEYSTKNIAPQVLKIAGVREKLKFGDSINKIFD